MKNKTVKQNTFGMTANDTLRHLSPSMQGQ